MATRHGRSFPDSARFGSACTSSTRLGQLEAEPPRERTRRSEIPIGQHFYLRLLLDRFFVASAENNIPHTQDYQIRQKSSHVFPSVD
jgi:hypothetical protein